MHCFQYVLGDCINQEKFIAEVCKNLEGKKDDYERYANAECPIAVRQFPKQPFFYLGKCRWRY